MKGSTTIFAAPLFLLLLPLYFILHGYTQNFASVTSTDLLQLAAEHLLLSLALFLFSFFIFRRWEKAALFSFVLLFVHFYFGAIHDGLKNISPHFFLAKYSVLLPLLLTALVFLFFYLKRSAKTFRLFFLYLNFLFLVLILMETPFFFRTNQSKSGQTLSVCTTCNKPDVYFIIADEYADSIALADALHFNNSGFLGQLRNRGFHLIQGSRSNYNKTPFAVASYFQMDYLTGIEGVNSSRDDRNICAAAINQNPVISFFKKSGYDILNFSIFKLNDQQTKVKQQYLLVGKDLIQAQTFLHRVKKDIGYHLILALNLQQKWDVDVLYAKQANEKLLSLLQNEIQQKRSRPKFIYTHLLMPHSPYYFDKQGKEVPPSTFGPHHEFDKEAYLSYLQYCNDVFIRLIDDILKNSSQPPIILFLSDHGFRGFRGEEKIDPRYLYMNLNAVYLPSMDYRLFYPGLSGVNQFRVLLNSVFEQNLPLLKDSTIFIRE